MNEMELLTRLRAEVPTTVAPQAEQKFLATIRTAESVPARPRATAALSRTAARMRANPARWRLAIAGGLTLALTAGLLAAATVRIGGTKPPASASAVMLLANRAAAAAAAQPAFSPGQWIYIQRLDRMPGKGMRCFPKALSTKPVRSPISGKCPTGATKTETWSTADGTRTASFDDGKLTMGGGALTPVSYAHLGWLPRDPAAVVRYLAKKWAYPKTGGGPASAAFQAIMAILNEYVVPPALAAELYLALAGIPGVTVTADAIDLAGRHGPAFTLRVENRPGYDILEVILDPRTYSLMGFTEASYGITSDVSQVHLAFGSESAILRRAPVPGPGVRP